MTVPQALNAALAAHQSGDYSRAEQLYRQVLGVDPHNTDALHLLGLVLFQTGRTDEAPPYLREALRLKPDFAQAHYNLGNILREMKQPAEAAASYHRALQLQPAYAEAWYNLGNAYHDLKQHAAAAEAHRKAVHYKPNYTKALNNLGNAYLDLRQPAEAAACYRQILQQNPGYAKGYCNLGHALRELGELEASADQCRKSIELDPANPEAYNNLGAALMDQGRIQAALDAFGAGLAIRPDYAEAHMNRAMTWLLAGDFEQGWPEYEWRWRSKAFTPRGFAQPLWDGGPLDNRTILLHAEQGLGDTLHFVRYVPQVKQRGGRVIVECSGALHRLLQGFPGIDGLVAAGQPLPAFDVHAPFLSLPGLLYDAATWQRAATHPASKGEATPFASEPYLFPQPDLKEHWQRELAGSRTEFIPIASDSSRRNEYRATTDGFKVGINWQGNPQHPKDRQRSIPLAQFLPLSQIAGVRLISLQKNFGIEQLQSLPAGAEIEDLGSRLDETSGAFMDTAAVLTNLDLVITSDTALAHLAGAMGVPVWVPLCSAPDWRWLLDRDDTPWYPSMRLFRQRLAGNWDADFSQIRDELASWIEKQARNEESRPKQ